MWKLEDVFKSSSWPQSLLALLCNPSTWIHIVSVTASPLQQVTNQSIVNPIHTHTQATFRNKELTFCCVFWFGCCWTVCGKLTVGFCTVFGSCTVCTCPLFGIVPPVPVGRFQLTPVLAFVRNEKVFLVPPVLNVCWKTWRSILSDYVLLLHIR